MAVIRAMRASIEIGTSEWPDPILGRDAFDWQRLRQDSLDLAAKLEEEGWDRLRAVRLMHLLSQ
jgi:hypothetical protein